MPVVLEELKSIAIKDLVFDDQNPRRDVGDISELRDSIRERGVIEPIVVRPVNGHYSVVAGRRRWAAATAAGLTEIPSIVRPLTDEEAAAAALVENLQRKDLSPLEEARGYRAWLDLTHGSQADLARAVGKAPSTIANALRLLAAPGPLIKALESGDIAGAHGKVLLELADPALFEKVKLNKGLTVRELQDQVVSANRWWENAGGPAIAAAKAFLEEARAKHPKATITWFQARDHRETGTLGLVDALGKPPAAIAGPVHNARVHDKNCECRAYAIEALIRYDNRWDQNDLEETYKLEGFELKRACVDDDGYARYRLADGRGRTTYSDGGSKPARRSAREIARDRARKQREQRERIARYVTGRGAYARDGQKPGPDVFKKFTAGGYAGDKAARLVLLALATEHVYMSSDMPQIVRGVMALSASKVRELVLERAAARVNSHAIAHAADQAPYDRQLARYELLTAFGVKASEPKKKQRAKAKAKR